MKNTIPYTPFSTALSGSARLTEMRLKNIFSGPKKRPPVLFLALMFSICVFCGNLVSCDVAEAEGKTDDISQADTSQADSSLQEAEALVRKDPFLMLAKDLEPDLNHNGVPEEIRLEDGQIRFYENGQIVDREWPGVCLYCYTGGPWYILRDHAENGYPGSFFYYYSLNDLSGEFEETLQWNRVDFDLNFNAPFHSGFDPAAIAAYVEELTGPLGWYSHSWRLVERDGVLVAEFPEETLPWLDQFPEVFTRDPDKTLEENLRDFQEAMTAAYPAPAPMGEADALPFDQPLEMIFLSGVGAWCTGLDLEPDGTFTADYHDSDGNIQYVCQYHGKFKDFVQLTEWSWSLTLEELVVDTEHPVGEEWDEDDIHYISSKPIGISTEDGGALQPGAQFILYSPDAQGYGPGTELYGAEWFWEWVLPRPEMSGTSDTLGCWGLYNLEGGIGFFSN